MKEMDREQGRKREEEREDGRKRGGEGEDKHREGKKSERERYWKSAEAEVCRSRMQMNY